MADLDPFATAGFAPVAPTVSKAQDVQIDPFSAAGFAPTAQAAQTSMARPTMPTPIGSDEFGAPVFDEMNKVGFDAGKQVREGALRAAEKTGEGATLGMLPYAIAGARTLGGTPFGQGLQEARDFTAQSSKDSPIGSMLAEGAGGLIPTMATFGAAAPTIAAARSALPEIPYLTPIARAMLSPVAGRIMTGAGLGGANAAGHDLGSGQTADIGSDVAKSALIGGGLQGAGEAAAPVLQAVPNAARSLVAGGRNIFTDAGNQGVVGQVLRESAGDFPNQAAASPIQGLTLRVPQVTGNPGLTGLESALASEPGAQAGKLGDLVTNNRTPDQVSALARAMVGSDAGIEPAVLTNQASARGVAAIQNADKGLGDVETSLWNTPSLKSVGISRQGLNGPGIASGVAQDVAAFPASWRDAVTGPQNKLGSYLDELKELGPNATIPEVNSVRSRLLRVSRDAASGPQPDSVTAAAAGKMADSLLDKVGMDPAIAGAPGTPGTAATVGQPTYSAEKVAGISTFVKTPGTVTPGVPGTPETPANTSARDAYQTARDFTRQFNQAKGYNEFSGILHPNSQGNMQGNAEKQFGQFFDTTGGTSAGLQRLQGLADFTRKAGLTTHADELESAGRQYLGASILKQARAGNGLTPTGQPAFNLATLASTTNKMAPALNDTAMTAGMASQVQGVGNAAELLNRPSTLRGITNSPTYELLRRNDLVNAILAQSATSGLGGLAGGYAGYEYGPEGVPAYARIPAGALAGAMLGRTAGPGLGSIISHTPVLKGIGAGASEGIRKQVFEALSNMPAYERAIATPMLSGPPLGQSGAVSGAVRAAPRLLVAPSTGRSAP